MRIHIILFLLLAGSLQGLLNATPVVDYQVTSVGSNFQYNYSFSGLSLLNNQELDIFFNAALYGQISNGVAPVGYNLELFQPNVPAGSSGEYSLLATTNNPTTVGTFSVQFTYLGGGVPPSQLWQIYNDNTVPLSLLATGQTVDPNVIPEPSSLWLCGAGMMMCVVPAVRRRAVQKTSSQAA